MGQGREDACSPRADTPSSPSSSLPLLSRRFPACSLRSPQRAVQLPTASDRTAVRHVCAWCIQLPLLRRWDWPRACVCVCVSGRGGCAACSHDCCSALRALGSHMRSRECPCVVHVVTCCPSIHACLCALCECVLIACSQLCGGGEHMPSQLGGLGQEGTRGFWPVHTCERHVCWLPQGLRSWPGLGKLSAVRVDG